MGPCGRRRRWHSKLNNFHIEVVHIPGISNDVADSLSRWAYPASEAAKDVSWHGTKADMEEMQEQLKQEREEERNCPKARHPAEEEKEQKSALAAAVTMEDGARATLVQDAAGKQWALLKVTSIESTDRPVWVVTRQQARREGKEKGAGEGDGGREAAA